MKKNLLLFSISLLILFIIISCTDKVDKMLLSDSQMRIEYSKCNGCYECLDEFNCPEDAIIKDPQTNQLTVYIDAEKCTNCMKCVNVFNCPQNAITSSPDLIRPGEIEFFEAISDSAGVLDITFLAPGDDGDSGLVYRYELKLLDQDGSEISYQFQMPLILKEAGQWENWTITDLTPDQLITVKLQAFDESGSTSAQVTKDVVIANIYIDIFPPAQIIDLTSLSQEENVILNWTAVGDDSLTGNSFRYEIRYSEELVNDGNWSEATEITQDIIPAGSGDPEEFIITDIPWQIDYYFAVKAFDSPEILFTSSSALIAK